MVEKYIEKEVKFQISNIEGFIENLKKLKAKFIKNSFQKTIRFDTKDKKLEKDGRFLRVRSGSKNILTMKIKRENKNLFEREEIESEIQDLEKVRKIINELGFNYERIMEKYRSDWLLDDISISVDELPFGFFVELEGEENNIFKLMEKLKLEDSKKIKVTYWDLFDKYKKENNKEDIGESILFDQGHKSRLNISKS